LHAFRNGLRTSFFLLSKRGAKTVKRVNPKSIKISDEIEKRPKRGDIVIFVYASLRFRIEAWGQEWFIPFYLTMQNILPFLYLQNVTYRLGTSFSMIYKISFFLHFGPYPNSIGLFQNRMKLVEYLTKYKKNQKVIFPNIRQS
jgi:hypothetical protein